MKNHLNSNEKFDSSNKLSKIKEKYYYNKLIKIYKNKLERLALSNDYPSDCNILKRNNKNGKIRINCQLLENLLSDIKTNGFLHISKIRIEPDHDQVNNPGEYVCKLKHHNNIFFMFKEEDNGKLKVMAAHEDDNVNN
jgi:hypothetical protein